MREAWSSTSLPGRTQRDEKDNLCSDDYTRNDIDTSHLLHKRSDPVRMGFHQTTKEIPFITSIVLAVVTTAWPLSGDAHFHKGTSIWTFGRANRFGDYINCFRVTVSGKDGAVSSTLFIKPRHATR